MPIADSLAHTLGTMGETKDNKYERLGKAIRKKREAQDISQRKLASMIGQPNSHTYITRVEKGQIKIGLEQLARIAEALDVEVRDLIDF